MTTRCVSGLGQYRLTFRKIEKNDVEKSLNENSLWFWKARIPCFFFNRALYHYLIFLTQPTLAVFACPASQILIFMFSLKVTAMPVVLVPILQTSSNTGQAKKKKALVQPWKLKSSLNLSRLKWLCKGNLYLVIIGHGGWRITTLFLWFAESVSARMSGTSSMKSSGPLPSWRIHFGRSLSYNSVKLCDCLDLCCLRVSERVCVKQPTSHVCIFLHQGVRDTRERGSDEQRLGINCISKLRSAHIKGLRRWGKGKWSLSTKALGLFFFLFPSFLSPALVVHHAVLMKSTPFIKNPPV